MRIANVRDFFKQYPDDETCLAHLFDVRYGQGHVCPKCEREAKWYPLASEKAFSCQWCGHHIHPMVGTIFERSRTPLQLWFYAIYLFTTTRHGVSAKELQRQLGVTYKTAYRMGQMIRKHMAAIDGEDPIGGEGKVVEVDEAYVGGKDKMGQNDKTIVLGMVERGGEAIIRVIPNASQDTVHGMISENVIKGTEVHADMHKAYNNLWLKGYSTKRVNKKATGRYVGPNGETVNSVENFWRHLKCSIKGTHISVSGKYLERYAKEFEYRFNRRMTPQMMIGELLTRFPELSDE
jgi:transposase